MPLGLAALLAAVGAASLTLSVFGGRGKAKRKLRVAAAVAGALILLASLAYILLAFIFLDAA